MLRSRQDKRRGGLYRFAKLSGAIVAHATANALIAAWAIAFGQWRLL